MKTNNIHDAKSQLSALINKVLRGEKIEIDRNNKPIVEFVALKKTARIPWQYKNTVKVIDTWQEADKEINELFDANRILPN